MNSAFFKFKIYFLVLTLLFSSVVFAQNSERLENTDHDAQLEEMARREAIRAAENPTQFENGITDITAMNQAGAMTLDMAKFYMAVAAVEWAHCLTSRDSTQCVQFMEGLKDPIGHIGFAIFMKTNHMTIDFAQVVTRKKINPGMASYLGLAAGMMAQSIFQDIYYHPKVQELFRTNNIRDEQRRKSERKRLLNELWIHFTKNSGKYLFNKIPNVLGLLGSAYVSHKTMQALGHLFTRSSRLVKFVFDPKTARVLIRFGANLIRQRQMIKAGIKFVWKGSRLVKVNPVVAIGSYFVETIVFLIWAPIIEEQAVKHWDRANAMWTISRSKSALTDAISDGKSIAEIETEARKVVEGMDRFRDSIMSKAEITKMRHLMSINKVDKEFQKMLLYYEWLIQGMDMESDVWTLNEGEFHNSRLIDSINESMDFANGFFCGQSVNSAVEREVDIAGVPVPLSWSFDYNYDANRTYYENMRSNEGIVSPTGIRINPFKVHHIDNICESDLRRMNGNKRPDSYDKITCPLEYHPNSSVDRKIEWKTHTTYALFCRVYQNQARQYTLISGRYKGRDIRDDFADSLDLNGGMVMRKIWSQRDLMIMSFEKSVRTELAKGLTGKNVVLRDDDSLSIYGSTDTTSFITGSIPLGMIAHLDYEIAYWQELYNENSGAKRTLFSTLIEETRKKKKAAQDLLDYTKLKYSERVRSQEFFREMPTDEWQKVVHKLREYIVP